MIEVYGNYWDVDADVRVITTNLDVNRNGRAVMGRGIALQAATRWTWLPGVLGDHLRYHGPIEGLSFWHDEPDGDTCEIVSLPVKYHWHERANVALIAQNLAALGRAYGHEKGQRVVLVRPGCGNGGLDWERDRIKDLCEILLPGDHFIVVSPGEEVNGPVTLAHGDELRRTGTLVFDSSGQVTEIITGATVTRKENT